MFIFQAMAVPNVNIKVKTGKDTSAAAENEKNVKYFNISSKALDLTTTNPGLFKDKEKFVSELTNSIIESVNNGDLKKMLDKIPNERDREEARQSLLTQTSTISESVWEQMQGKGGKGFETCLSAAVCFQIGNAIGLDFSKSSVSEIEKRLYVGAVSDINKASLGILVDALIILSKQASNGKNNSDMGQADFNQRVQDIISYARMESIRNEQQTAQGWIEDSKKKRRNSEFFS